MNTDTKRCYKCGKTKSVDEFGLDNTREDKLYPRCKECVSKYNKNKNRDIQKRWRDNYASKGLCVNCGNPTIEHSKTLCSTCWYKAKSSSALGTVKHWQYLKRIMVKQNCKCAYSHIDLVEGLNASIDHILPKSLYPELINDPRNVVWCDLRVNSSKHQRTVPEFIEVMNSRMN